MVRKPRSASPGRAQAPHPRHPLRRRVSNSGIRGRRRAHLRPVLSSATARAACRPGFTRAMDEVTTWRTIEGYLTRLRGAAAQSNCPMGLRVRSTSTAAFPPRHDRPPAPRGRRRYHPVKELLGHRQPHHHPDLRQKEALAPRNRLSRSADLANADRHRCVAGRSALRELAAAGGPELCPRPLCQGCHLHA